MIGVQQESIMLKQRSVQLRTCARILLAWVGYMATSLLKIDPPKHRMLKQFTSYLLPFMMNTNTFETT